MLMMTVWACFHWALRNKSLQFFCAGKKKKKKTFQLFIAALAAWTLRQGSSYNMLKNSVSDFSTETKMKNLDTIIEYFHIKCASPSLNFKKKKKRLGPGNDPLSS